MSVILAFVVAFETAFHYHSVHGTVSLLTNRFLSVTGKRRLGFERRRYGRLFLAIAGLLVQKEYLLLKHRIVRRSSEVYRPTVCCRWTAAASACQLDWM